MNTRPVVPSLVLLASLSLTTACAQQGIKSNNVKGSSPIVGGTTDTGDEEVALILYNDPSNPNNEFVCSGTLISPTAVLTAGHCGVVDDTCNSPDNPTTCAPLIAANYMVLGGTSPIDTNTWEITNPDWTASVTAVNPNPNYGSDDTGAPMSDVTVLNIGAITVNNGSGPTPVAWLSTQDDDAYATGNTVTAVGFGITDGTTQVGVGTKRSVGLQIQSQDANTFTFGSADANTCSGDSGGPAFEMINGVQTVVGTTSYGDQTCTQLGVDMRTDANAAFISQFTGD